MTCSPSLLGSNTAGPFRPARFVTANPALGMGRQ
jgi:hypothetical protein